MVAALSAGAPSLSAAGLVFMATKATDGPSSIVDRNVKRPIVEGKGRRSVADAPLDYDIVIARPGRGLPIHRRVHSARNLRSAGTEPRLPADSFRLRCPERG